MHCWNCSAADLIPKGNLHKQKCPNSVMKVIKGIDSAANGICQHPDQASSFVKTLFLVLAGHFHLT